MNLRTQLETRFGIPFSDLMQRFADIDVDRKSTAALLNVSYPALMKLLERHGDPFPAHAVTVRYRQETGEFMTVGIQRLSGEHSRSGAARVLGVSESSIRRCVATRNLDVSFRRRERREWRQHRATGQARRTSPTWQTYEFNGVKGSLRELTEQFGQVPLATVRRRVHQRGWTLEKALTLSIEDAVRQARDVSREQMDRLWAPRIERARSAATKTSAIRKLAKTGISAAEIAREVGCSRGMAHMVAYHGQ